MSVVCRFLYFNVKGQGQIYFKPGYAQSLLVSPFLIEIKSKPSKVSCSQQSIIGLVTIYSGPNAAINSVRTLI